MKIPTLQNFYNDVLQDFQKIVFHTQNTIFVFNNIRMFVIIQDSIDTTVEVYKLHALINGNKEKTLQWSYNVTALKLQCDGFKLLK